MKSVSAKGSFYLVGFQSGRGAGATGARALNNRDPERQGATEWLRIYQEHPSSADAPALAGKTCRLEVSKGAVRDFLAEGEPVCSLRDGLEALGWVPRIAVSRRRESLKAVLRAAQDAAKGPVPVSSPGSSAGAAAAVAAVLRDPFIALEVDAEDLAFGVEAAAGLALAAGAPLAEIAASAAKHAVRAAEASSGHVCVPAKRYPSLVSASLGAHKHLFSTGCIDGGVSACVEKGDLVACGGMIYGRAMFEAEEYVRGFLERRSAAAAASASGAAGPLVEPESPEERGALAPGRMSDAPGHPETGEPRETGEREETPRIAESSGTLSAEQESAVAAAVACHRSTGVMVLTGGAGTGKSRTVGAIVGLLGSSRVLLCAPTGKAARRLEKSVETVVGCGAGPTGMTVHRLLGIGCPPALISRRDLRTRAAAGGPPLPTGDEVVGDGQLLVVDETSMLDLRLARRICSAADRYRLGLLFVGDPNQLPSVGPGRVLDDLVEWAAGGGALRALTEIRRQGGASPIAALGRAVVEGDLEACERLLGRRDGGESALAAEIDNGGRTERASTTASDGKRLSFSELVLVEPGPDGGLTEAVNAYADAGGLSEENFGSVQVLSGRREGPSSADEINSACVLSLDPGRALTPWGAPRTVAGDKVVVTANAAGGSGASGSSESGCGSGSGSGAVTGGFASAVPARNGDIGLLIEYTPGGTSIVEVSDDRGGRGAATDPTATPIETSTPRAATAPSARTYVSSKASDVGHGHAVTVHKFQGCEADTVVFAIHRAHSRMLHSNLIYTAVTRARRRLVIVGKLGVFLGAVSTRAPERHSGGFAGGRRAC